MATLSNLNTQERQGSLERTLLSLLLSRAHTTSLKCQPSLCREEEKRLPHQEMFRLPMVINIKLSSYTH